MIFTIPLSDFTQKKNIFTLIQIGLDRKHVSEDTRMLFCTTGVLLEKLIASKTLTHFTHIVLDEVHERDKDMDFLFIIIRMLMAKDAPNVKIILMSATIDCNMVSDWVIEIKSNFTEKQFILSISLQITLNSIVMVAGGRHQLLKWIRRVHTKWKHSTWTIWIVVRKSVGSQASVRRCTRWHST